MYLSPIQKIILESISSSPKSLEEISNDIKLESIQVLKNIHLIMEQHFIIKHRDKYSLNSKKALEISKSLNHYNTKTFDIKKISESFLDPVADKKINFKKVHLSKEEMNTVTSLLKQLDFYLNTKMNRKSDQPLHKKHIFYWGRQTYEEAYL